MIMLKKKLHNFLSQTTEKQEMLEKYASEILGISDPRGKEQGESSHPSWGRIFNSSCIKRHFAKKN